VTLDALFLTANLAVLPGWALLLFAPRWRPGARLIAGALIPAALALVYLGVMLAYWGAGEGDFGSLEGVGRLFDTPGLLLAGWIHYLAFDLFIGSWEIRDAQDNGIPHLLAAPCALLTFVLGPIGLFAYLVVRAARTGSPFLGAPR